jgi:hypothetical protein
MHCRRNARFYPGFMSANVSGRARTLREFIEWAEEMDSMRRTHQYSAGARPLAYPQYQPLRWIDPRDEASKAVPWKALWSR